MQVLIFEKASLQTHRALPMVGLSLTAARLVKEMTAASRSEMDRLDHERLHSAFTSGVWSAVS